MVDYGSSWDPLPSHSVHPTHTQDLPLSQVRKDASKYAALLDENKDEQILKDACLGLCQLFGEGIQNDRIQAILDADVVPKLVALLKPSKSRSVPLNVQSAALQVLGNVACGDDRQTQVVIDSNALPCLRALLSSPERSIRKEVCWIVSNITESSHQVQDVLDADILPPLLKLLDNQDAACREDATWVLFNLSSNRDPNQIAYLAENNGVRALCNLLTCSKELDVFWKGCRTVAAVALKGLRNILISGQIAAASDSNGYNKMAALVAEAHGVERIEALTIHVSPDVRTRARLLLERMFGAERTTADYFPVPSPPTMANLSTTVSATNPSCCQCTFQQQHHHHHHSHSTTTSSTATTHYSNIYDVNTNFSSSNSNHTSASATLSPSHLNHGIATVESTTIQLQSDAEFDPQGSTSGSSTDSDPEEDDSDADLIPPPPAPCSCVLCTDPTPLADRRPRGKNSFDDNSNNDGKRNIHEDRRGEIRQICNFCSGGGRLGDGRAGLAAKLGRAVRLGHPHCIAILLSRMTWAQRIAATEAPALLHPGGGPPDGGVGNSLPAFILAAQLGKPDCLALLLRRCRPELDLTYGKKRLTALAWAAHKGYQKCCELLIESGASPSTKCGDGVTALHLAASAGGHIGICKLLLDHGAPVNIRSAKKQTPLCLAAQKGAAKIVQILLDHGADANNEDESKCTPLHLAASNGFVNCVEPLLKAGAKVDATARKDVTPLHYAVKRGHAAVVQVLIAAGAKVNCNRQPLLLIAADEGNPKVVRILLDANAQIDCKANIRAMLDKDTEILDYLTPLHFASSRGHRDVVELLLQRGANVNESTTKSGWSALDFAVLNGHADSAITLLQYNARVTDNCKSIGTNKWTLIQYAAHHGAKGVVRLLVQRLKEQGTSLSQQPENGIQSSIENGEDDTALDPTFPNSSGINNGSLKPWFGLESNLSTNDYHEDHGMADHYSPCGNNCHHRTIDHMNQGTHRYDLKSGDGNDPAFSPQSSSYNNGPGATEGNSKPNVSRRRVVKDDRQNNVRAREIRKREAEATEARDRLEEAISQRSVAKLNEAITHVSKLVLHLAATGGADGTGTGNHIDRDINGYSSHSDSYGGHIHSPSGKHSSSPTNSVLSSPLPMEVGLGNEVKKAQKILAGLLAEEKRIREEKEREAADSKRENAQQAVRKAITNALEGGDTRSLSKATNRATRTILDKNDPVVMEAITVITLISDLEKWESSLKISVHRKDLDGLSEALPRTTEAISELKNRDGEGAADRVFGGLDPSETVQIAAALLQELREKRQNEIAKEEKAKDLEKSAKTELEHAMKANDIQKLENALENANAALLSKESDLSTSIEAAKKVMTKWLKGERRKLRQATNTEDPETIEKAAMTAENFNLNALKGDIENAKSVADKIRKQSETRCRLEDAIESGDVIALTEIRKELNILGMFSEAEKARAQIERFQRATRARTLLEAAIADAETCQKPIIKSFSESKGVEEIMDVLSSWTWPDVQKLHDLTERARKYGQSLQSLCDSADNLAKELAVLGRRILAETIKSNDARAIAANIAGYEKSFMSIAAREIYDTTASEKAVAETKKRLAMVQAMDQESVKAEAAQNKVVYALATSRRSAARHRGTRKVTDIRGNIHASVDNLSPRIGRPNGRSVMQTDTRSPSSVTSDGVNDEISESDTPMNSMNPIDGTPNRGNDPTKSASKRNRATSNQIDDPAFLDSIGDSTTPTGECSHFYMYREGTTVCCSRCGNLRNSSNPEWLARVKRRSNKVGSDHTGTSPTIHPSPSDGQMKPQKHNTGLLPPNANAMSAAGVMGSGISTTSERSMPSAARNNLGPYAQQPVAQNYGLGSVPISIDSTRVPLPALAMRGNAPNTNMSFMVQLMQHQQAQQVQQAQHAQQLAQSQGIPPQVLSQHQITQAMSKASSNHGRGRARAPINQVSNNMEAHSQGITGMYRSSTNARRGPLSGNVSIADAVHMQSAYAGSTMHSMAPRLSAQQAQLRGYPVPSTSLPGMELKNSLRLSNDLNVNAMTGMNQTHVLHMDGLNMNHQPRTTMIPSGRINVARPGNVDDVGPSGVDLGHDFANENFGFDIDEIVDDTPRSPANKPAASTPDIRAQLYMQSSATAPAHQHHNGYYQR